MRDGDGDERDYYFDVDDLESMGSLTVASTDPSILAA
jgi:hypothetical protein